MAEAEAQFRIDEENKERLRIWYDARARHMDEKIAAGEKQVRETCVNARGFQFINKEYINKNCKVIPFASLWSCYEFISLPYIHTSSFVTVRARDQAHHGSWSKPFREAACVGIYNGRRSENVHAVALLRV